MTPASNGPFCEDQTVHGISAFPNATRPPYAPAQMRPLRSSAMHRNAPRGQLANAA